MKENSRTKNTIYNFTSSIGGQLISILMQFIVRTVFIHTLGKAYLGIDGLFSNILSMLSLAEMGVGSAIVFKLYEPISQHNEERINILMTFYKRIYRYIGVAVAVIGITLIPFLPYIINDYEKLTTLNINTILVYSVFLFDSVSSYFFFAYKSAIIKANQKEYYINLIGYLFTMACGIFQIIELLVFKNFVFYVAIKVIKTIAQNIIIAFLANHQFPYLKDKPQNIISPTEKKDIFKDCGALFLYRLNNVVVKSTDNIVLSIFLGLDSVALYSNYYIIFTSITTLFNKIYNAVGHSIGNLHTTHNTEKEYIVFESTMFIAAVIGGTTFAGIFVVANCFVNVWLGKEWLLSQSFTLLMGLELFTSSFKYAIAKYRTAYGLFKQGWIRPLISMIINLLISVALVKPLGIVGVLIGTVSADWLTFIWYDPLVVHKIGFGNQFPVKNYYKKFLKYVITTLLVGFADYYLCICVIGDHGWISIILYAIICVFTVPTALILASFKTKEVEYVKNLGKREIKAIKHKFVR